MSLAGLLDKPINGLINLQNKLGKGHVNKSLVKLIDDRVSQAKAMVSNGANYMDASHFVYTGEKFAGGWGLNRDYEIVDLPLVRRHSLELWRSNPIASAIFGRLETKVINDGLRVEALPEARFIGFTDDSPELQEWTEAIEAYTHLYAMDAALVDERQRFNLYQLQRQAYSTAKLSGDCLVIRRIDGSNMLPRIQLVDGKHIETPFDFSAGINPRTGNAVISGVEIDAGGREVGYWVRTRALKPGTPVMFDITYEFVPAFGPNSGRRVANLVYGSRLRVDEYRGMPLLGATMQMLKQIDRLLDNSQLASVLDASLVLSVMTDKEAPQDPSSMLGGGVMRAGAAREQTVSVPQPDGGSKPLNFKQFSNGMIIDNLARGQKIESHNTRHPNPDVAKSALFGVNLCGAACEVPPEILILTFNSNFSASRQAVNEFDAIRRKEHSQFNPLFNEPIYKDIVIGLDITGKLSTPGLMEAIVNGDRITFNAWTQSSFASTAELSVDMLKHVNMFKEAHKEGYVTHEQVALKFFGTRHKKVVGKLKVENEALAEARRPIVELEKGPATNQVDNQTGG
jgi:capsid protein